MSIKLMIRCGDNFKNKSRYVFDTFFRATGLSYSLANTDSHIKGDDILVYYGERFDEPDVKCPVIAIRPAKEVERYFSRREEYKIDRARRFRFKDSEYVSLFHNEKFVANHGNAIIESGDSVELNADLIASAFFFLSCWQEVTSDEFDMFHRFPSKASVQYQLGILDRPIVNEYFQIVKECIERIDNSPVNVKPRFHGKRFAICLTHDIDYLRKWSPGIVYREAVKYLLLNEQRKNFAERKERFKQFLAAFVANNDPYKYSIERILEVEQEFNVTSSFFFKTGATNRRDVSYSIRSEYVRNLIRRLENTGHEIGLHPSFNTYDNARIMRREKERLEKIVSNKVSGVRQHYLRFHIPTTWRLHEQLGFLYDTTLGFADSEGFRVGYCHPFQPYDVEKDKAMNIWELPLLVMDGTLTDYRKLLAEESLDIFKRLIFTVKKYNGVGVLLFHNTCYDRFDFAGWDYVFEKVVEFAFEEGAYLGNCKEIIELYTGLQDF